MVFTTGILNALYSVSQALNIPTDSLKKLIQFESKFDPLARNKITGARGLIQFLHSTAKGLGFKNADDLVNKYPDIESQLRGPVFTYLSRYMPYSSPQSLYMAVFYPAFRNVPIKTEFPEAVKRANPGIKTVADYIERIEKKKIKQYGSIGFFVPIAAALVVVFYPQFKRRRNNE